MLTSTVGYITQSQRSLLDLGSNMYFILSHALISYKDANQSSITTNIQPKVTMLVTDGTLTQVLQ
jgi:hypothetical protein